MRVNVTYSVELEEVLALVKGILAETTEKLDDLSQEFPRISTALEMENESKASEIIANCRKLTAAIDHRLFDCKSILMGYQATSLQLEENDHPTATGESFDEATESG